MLNGTGSLRRRDWWTRAVPPLAAGCALLGLTTSELTAQSGRSWFAPKPAAAPATTLPPQNGFAGTIERLLEDARRQAAAGQIDEAIQTAQRARKIAEASSAVLRDDPAVSTAAVDNLLRDLHALREAVTSSGATAPATVPAAPRVSPVTAAPPQAAVVAAAPRSAALTPQPAPSGRRLAPQPAPRNVAPPALAQRALPAQYPAQPPAAPLRPAPTQHVGVVTLGPPQSVPESAPVPVSAPAPVRTVEPTLPAEPVVAVRVPVPTMTPAGAVGERVTRPEPARVASQPMPTAPVAAAPRLSFENIEPAEQAASAPAPTSAPAVSRSQVLATARTASAPENTPPTHTAPVKPSQAIPAPTSEVLASGRSAAPAVSAPAVSAPAVPATAVPATVTPPVPQIGGFEIIGGDASRTSFTSRRPVIEEEPVAEMPLIEVALGPAVAYLPPPVETLPVAESPVPMAELVELEQVEEAWSPDVVDWSAAERQPAAVVLGRPAFHPADDVADVPSTPSTPATSSTSATTADVLPLVDLPPTPPAATVPAPTAPEAPTPLVAVRPHYEPSVNDQPLDKPLDLPVELSLPTVSEPVAPVVTAWTEPEAGFDASVAIRPSLSQQLPRPREAAPPQPDVPAPSASSAHEDFLELIEISGAPAPSPAPEPQRSVTVELPRAATAAIAPVAGPVEFAPDQELLAAPAAPEPADEPKPVRVEPVVRADALESTDWNGGETAHVTANRRMTAVIDTAWDSADQSRDQDQSPPAVVVTAPAVAEATPTVAPAGFATNPPATGPALLPLEETAPTAAIAEDAAELYAPPAWVREPEIILESPPAVPDRSAWSPSMIDQMARIWGLPAQTVTAGLAAAACVLLGLGLTLIRFATKRS